MTALCRRFGDEHLNASGYGEQLTDLKLLAGQRSSTDDVVFAMHYGFDTEQIDHSYEDLDEDLAGCHHQTKGGSRMSLTDFWAHIDEQVNQLRTATTAHFLAEVGVGYEG